ncbi:MAG: leucyl aminopeptidase, partial [Acidocella sp. 20-61-6]
MQLAGLAEQDGPALELSGVRPASLETCLMRLPERHAAQARAQGFKAEAGEIALLSGADGLEAALLGLGIGPVLHGFGAAAHALPPDSLWRISPGATAQNIATDEAEDAALGFLLGAYRFHRLKTTNLRRCALLAPGSVSRRARILAESICAARDLINTPPNLLGPSELAQAGLNLGLRFGAALEHIRGPALTERYPAMAAVGAGSDRAPEAVVLTWRGSEAAADAPLVSLCGKGVCFDTGGYDLKPSAAMLRMKKDMGGAAIMLGLTQAIISLDLPIRLQLRIGCVENSVSGGAMRPSDVLRTQAGISVEVGNTDAEGRLVLCDLLAEAARERPDWLIDAATLTGAARVALGPDLPAIFCTDDEMAEIIVSAGRFVHDPLWRLPLHAGYDSWLDSQVADLNTVAAKPMAGAIIAALF